MVSDDRPSDGNFSTNTFCGSHYMSNCRGLDRVECLVFVHCRRVQNYVYIGVGYFTVSSVECQLSKPRVRMAFPCYECIKKCVTCRSLCVLPCETGIPQGLRLPSCTQPYSADGGIKRSLPHTLHNLRQRSRVPPSPHFSPCTTAKIGWVYIVVCLLQSRTLTTTLLTRLCTSFVTRRPDPPAT